MPLDRVVVARRVSGDLVPTPGYLQHASEKFIRVTVVLGKEPPAKVEMVEDPNPPLESLFVAKETTVQEGRWRTNALIAVKNRTLPKLSSEGATADLKALVEKLEKYILAVNHEAELAKDTAQKEIEAGRPADVWRELVIVYKERIEVLKPMLVAIKDEITTRGK